MTNITDNRYPIEIEQTENKKRTRIIMDSQILTTYQLCEEMLNLRFNMNLVPIGGPGAAIEKGAMMHDILEAYYRAQMNGLKKVDAFTLAIAAGQAFIVGCEQCMRNDCKVHKRNEKKGLISSSLDEAHYVIQTFQQYAEKWKNDSWTTINVEYVKGKVIYEDDEISVMWKAKIDWYVDNQEGMFSTDHKTASRREEPLSLDNQFIGQAVVTEQTKMFRNVVGFQTSLKPEEKFTREAVNFSKARIAEWILETASYAYDLKDTLTNNRY